MVRVNEYLTWRKALIVLALTPVLMAAKCSPTATITCPTLKQYSQEFLAKAGDELDRIEEVAPNIVQMVNDYGVERDAIRKCIKLRAKGQGKDKKKGLNLFG